MKGDINGFNWINVEPMKYWSFAASYKGDRKRDVMNFIFSGDYIGALKVDGFYQRLVKDDNGEIAMISRSKSVSGEYIDKHEWVPHLNPYFESLPNGTCLLCECYLPGDEGSRKITSLLGCLKDKCIARQEANQKLHLYVFDIMAYNGESFSEKDYAYRAKTIEQLSTTLPNDFVEYAKFYEGKELWSKVQEYLADGREGMVIMKKTAPVYFKRTPARVSIKIKKELADTIDCFFTGRATAPKKEYSGKEVETWKYWIDSITNQKLAVDEMNNYYADYANGTAIEPVTKSYYYDFAGSLEIAVLDDDGKVVPIGFLSGLTEEIKKNPKNYKGKCIEVSAMEMDTSVYPPTLRHGKMIQFRNDLTINDCTMKKVLGDK